MDARDLLGKTRFALTLGKTRFALMLGKTRFALTPGHDSLS